MKTSLAAFILVFLWSETMATDTEYTNMWLAEIHGGEEVAKRVARDFGYTYKSKVNNIAFAVNNVNNYMEHKHCSLARNNLIGLQGFSEHSATICCSVTGLRRKLQQAAIPRYGEHQEIIFEVVCLKSRVTVFDYLVFKLQHMLWDI